MPTYFIDVAAAGADAPHAEGIDLDSDEAARALALDTLADMVRERVSLGQEAGYRVSVRAEGDRLVGHATLKDGWRPG